MRKILLATTALIGVALAGSAQASAPTSPISLNVGGYNDFIAATQNGGTRIAAGGETVGSDFEDEFKISFDALGKASNGIEYGANISLWNGAEVNNIAPGATGSTAAPWAGGLNTVTVNSAYVWLSGAFGKVLFGDEHGASDLFVYAPTVGEGQIDGRYTDFISSSHIASFMIRPSGTDNTEHSTKVTYYTPKVGNDSHKVQLGVSFAPSLYDYGQSAILTHNGGATALTNGNSPYRDVIEGDVQYTGSFKPVDVTVSAQWVHGGSGHAPLNTTALGSGLSASQVGNAHSFNAWGLGTQVAFNGVTLGGGYNRLGAYNTVEGQNRTQDSWNVGVKYEFDKVGVAANFIHGKGYDNLLTGGVGGGVATSATNYVKRFNAGGVGATYTWFPGLTSNVDGVIYGQERDAVTATDQTKQGGYTVLVSQRLAF